MCREDVGLLTSVLSPHTCTRDHRQSFLGEQVVAPVRDARTLAKEARSRRKETAGRGWFDLPATQITDEVRRRCSTLLQQRSCRVHAEQLPPRGHPMLVSEQHATIQTQDRYRQHIPCPKQQPSCAMQCR